MFGLFKGKSKKVDPPSRRHDADDLDDENEEGRASKVVKALYSWVLILLGFSILLVVQFPFFQEVHKISGHFIEEFGFALALAGLFSLTVEKYHREEFRRFVMAERKRLKRDVFLYAYGHAVAEETRTAIKDLILDCPFNRDQLRLEWHFSAHESNENKVKLTKIYSYTQRNGTKLPQSYSYQLHQNSTNVVLAQVVETQTRKVTIRKNGKEINLSKPDGSKPDNARELGTNEIGVLQPGEEIEVSITISESRDKTDDDSYSPKHPIVGLTHITVYMAAGLNMTAAAYCKAKALEQRTEHNPPHVHAWHICEGILPYQGIMVSWSPAEMPAPKSASVGKNGETNAQLDKVMAPKEEKPTSVPAPAQSADPK